MALLFLSAVSNVWAADPPQPRPRPCNCPPPPKPRVETCEERAARLIPVPNTIESTAIIAIGSVDDCFLPQRRSHLVAAGSEVGVSVRLVYNDGLFIPLSGREIRVSIVDSFGTRSSPGALNRASVRTRRDGFADPITFRPADLGVYRIRVDYKDRDSDAHVLSPNIIVVSSGAAISAGPQTAADR